ncbi:MAG: bifunctional homocysteine S-methyltransferase/methylenetetrahydrofolate reductase [Candidatus Aminicenantes bacterium]|nr:bifunctional homocysteine S-methyltransferase/methylenetetrahydrofolate reductase [Candidatus Aminicenantes bacterium]NIM83065.1 bifunctional homocysteine S-methyltransferase/methylenetetrahydrofolate reductase [Candidatus Aminicenantes bacterium]NIN22444.1 bifunctional homocysteine S-methyltransferase/methylenetetrahydrofolate reductase [Candidatus Aminicenantes bacterium]NIN46212.1 bifunctional homocysteine S-methyltransferase/methylenetetrahydrofolate reductase [Candidatus Aminicenantes ba
MTKKEFLDRLKDSVMLFDGATGTMFYSHGIFINRCYDELNLSRPELVKEIHSSYVEAGADCIETNTFGANRVKLERHGFREKLAEINYEGAHLAREAAGPDVLVAGSIGPLGVKIEPWGPMPKSEAREIFEEQARALKDGEVDLFILETFTTLSEIEQAITAVKEVCDLPVIASMSVREDGNLMFGTQPESYIRALEEWNVDAVGLNCSVGPHHILETLETIVKLTDKPISAMPNAGLPRSVEGRTIYMTSPEYMAEYVRRFIQIGVKIIGGCCGTTKAHIKAMRNAIASIIPQKQPTVRKETRETVEKAQPIPLPERSMLGKKLAEGDFVTSVEITPPRGCEPIRVLESSKKLKENHVDAVNIPDGPRALTRMSAQHLSILIQQQVGIETILHYTCRDRNLLGMMSDMLGLDAVGIKNLLLITGDPPKMGDYPDATAVFDVDSIGLTNMVNNLNHGLDLGSNRIGKPTGYVIGVGLNPCAVDVDTEIRRFEQKVKAGADFAITQPVFDVKGLMAFLEKITQFRIPIITGVWPLVSLRNAEFMNNEVPGVSVPDEIMERMRATKSKEEALQEGINIACQMVRQIKDQVQGIQVSAPFGKVKYALDVLAALR